MRTVRAYFARKRRRERRSARAWSIYRSSFILLVPLLATSFFSRATPQKSPKGDPLPLLNEVSQRYADAKSFHIEAVQERTSSNELERDWQKTLFTAIVMPGGRYRYEGRSGFGSAILVSDGTTRWIYHLDEHLYTQEPAITAHSENHRIITAEEAPAQEAKHLESQLARLADSVKSATFLPDENILVNGRSIACYVVHLGSDDLKTKLADRKEEQTIWIDKSRKVVVKTLIADQSYTILAGSNAHIPMSFETMTIYPVVELDREEPEGAFAFVPPAEAKRVAAFPYHIGSGAHQSEGDNFIGKPAPELLLKSSDGSLTRLSSFRGRPVFIEFWATWCGPCVDLMPSLAELYAETSDKGLVFISIDQDDEPSAATTFLARERINWPNYHDDDGSLGKAFHREGIPLGVLIGADGKVIFYRTGYEISDLRAAVAKLGPNFITITERPK